MSCIEIDYHNYRSKKTITDLAKDTFTQCKGLLNNCISTITLKMPADVFSLIVKENQEEVSFGEYPQSIVSEEISSKLESIYRSLLNSSPEKIVPINEEYDIVESRAFYVMEEEYSQQLNSNCRVFRFDGKKYIRLKSKVNKETKWYNVEPVLWKIDRENNQLISKHSIINGLFEYNSYLYWGSHVRFSDKKTTKYLENTFLKELLQSVKLKKVIVYEDFNDLESIIKENNNFKNFEDLVEIEFNGPALNSKELNYVRGALGKNIKMNFITIEKEEGKKFDKYKVIKAKEEAENKEKLNQDYQSILKNIKELRLLIESFAQNKMVSNDMLRNLYSSIRVPDDMLIVKVKDHFEFNPDLLDVLDCIDLSRVDAHNLKLSNLDLRNKNITFDPQVIYRKDLSNSKLADHNVIWSSFKGVNLSGADIGDEKESYDIDQAKIDENTILPEKKSKTL